MSAKSARHARAFRSIFSKKNLNRGKITLASTLLGAIVLPLVGMVFFELQTSIARADNVPTSVTVLNTPPTWDVMAEESTESSTSTPTNAGQVLSWVGTGSDSSGDRYYLLICKTGGAPSANPNTSPTCNGGIGNQWAVSASTTSGTPAIAATTTKDTFPFNNESNDWWAWICDGNAASPRCNTVTPSQGSGNTASPFVINHTPIFSAINNDSPANPGETVTWNATAHDNDTLDTQDQVQLFICRTNSFSTSTGCTGGAWATSTFATSDPATTTEIAIPFRDDNYPAFAFIMDNHGLAASSTFSSAFVVNNVAPTLTSADVALNNGSDIVLTTPGGSSGPYTVNITVTDNNSCRNAANNNEIASVVANIYRSGVGQSSCQASTGHYSPNSCYPNADPLFTPHISCTQSGPDSCGGPGDPTVSWTCTFSLWYTADPTDGTTAADSQYYDQQWLASVRVTDDDTATSSLVESPTASEVDVTSFLAFNVTETSIGYESLEPGQNSSVLGTSTDLVALGNIGLDEDLYGDTMCPTSLWTTPDSCDTDGFQSARDIPVSNQKFATSSVAYGSGSAFALTGSSTPSTLLINVPKTISTSSPQSRDTYWGIAIPGVITTAGAYEGQNTITAKKSDPAFW